MGAFFSNKQQYIKGEERNTLFIEQSISFILDMGCIHLSIPAEDKFYDGRFFQMDNGTLVFITYDMSKTISLVIAGNKVIKIGVHPLNDNILEEHVLYEQEVDYDYMCEKIDHEVLSKDGRKIAILRDRGMKTAILTWPQYNTNGILNLFNKEFSKFDSYYLTWARFYTIGQDYELPTLVSVLKSMQDVNMLEKVMLTDRMQCLGIALCLSELIDRFSIDTKSLCNEPVMFYLVEYAFFAISIYLATYKGADVLKDAELFAILGRICDLHKKILISLLINCGIMNLALIDDMYVSCMHLASQSAPNAFLRQEYFRNALMMHQNQTVGGVTTDHMDESYLDSVNLGISCMNEIVDKQSKRFRANEMVIPENEMDKIDAGVQRIIQSSLNNPARNNIKALCIVSQIHKYRVGEEVKVPLPTHVKSNLDTFLQNVKAISTYETTCSDGDSKKCILRNGENCNVDVRISSLIITWDESRNIQAIKLYCTTDGYKLKKEIDRKNIFYGFVCRTAFCDLMHLPQTIMLLPFIANDAI